MACQRYSGLFCRLPFDQMVVEPSGDVFFCCQPWLPVSIGNLHEQTLEEIWNSAWAQKIRASILDGTFRYCQEGHCPHLQGEAGNIFKLDELPDAGYQAMVAAGNTELAEGPRRISIGYDPTCNLACPSCRDGYVVAKGETRAKAESLHKRVFGSPLLNTARLLFLPNMGEVFSSPLYRSILREWDRERFPNLRIQILTNGLLFTERMWSTLEKVHGVLFDVMVSINAARPDSFAEIQKGGDFNRLLQNLAFMQRLRAQGVLEQFTISFVVQARNFREMKEFVALGKGFGVDGIVFDSLANWHTFTEEEFRSRAVHLPEHPEHEEFKALFQDPVFLDPVVETGNLSIFHKDFDYAIPRAHAEAVQEALTMQTLIDAVMLTPAQAKEAERIINAMKDHIAEIATLASVEGPSPVDVWRSAASEGHAESACSAAFMDFLQRGHERVSGTPYMGLMGSVASDAMSAMQGILSTRQMIALQTGLHGTLNDIDTGRDPLGDAIRGVKAPVTVEGQPHLAHYRAAGLSEAQVGEVAALIAGLKRDFAQLNGLPAENGAQAPLRFLLARLRGGDSAPQGAFLEYLRAHRPAGSASTYLEQFVRKEMALREKLSGLIGPQKLAALQPAGTESLMDIPCGEDPFDAALQAIVSEEAASQATAVEQRVAPPRVVRGIETFEGLRVALSLRPRQIPMIAEVIGGLQASTADMTREEGLAREAEFRGELERNLGAAQRLVARALPAGTFLHLDLREAASHGAR